MSRARRALKRAVERTLGVTILREPPSKHFYPVLARLRGWSPEDVIFDVGANDGRTVLRLQELIPTRPRIFAFEPVSATYDILRARTAGMDNVRTFHRALGDAPGRAEMHLHELSVMNSFVTAPESPGEMEEVEIGTVDGMMEELDLDFVHFLKIDTEGFEANVLKGAAGALSEARIALVQTEFHLTEEEGLRRLEDLLAPYGYELFGLYNQTLRPPRTSPDPRFVEAAGFEPRRLDYADAVFTYTGAGRP